MTVLYQGGTVAICEGLKHIVKNMAECRATIMLGVPLVFEMMHKRVWKQAEKTGKAAKLKKGLMLAKKLDTFIFFTLGKPCHKCACQPPAPVFGTGRNRSEKHRRLG